MLMVDFTSAITPVLVFRTPLNMHRKETYFQDKILQHFNHHWL